MHIWSGRGLVTRGGLHRGNTYKSVLQQTKCLGASALVMKEERTEKKPPVELTPLMKSYSVVFLSYPFKYGRIVSELNLTCGLLCMLPGCTCLLTVGLHSLFV